MSEAERRLFNIMANSERSYKKNAPGGINAFIQNKKKKRTHKFIQEGRMQESETLVRIRLHFSFL